MKVLAWSVLVLCAVLATVVMGARLRQPEKDPVMKTQVDHDPAYSKSGFKIQPLSKSQIDKLAEKLTPDEAKVILKKGTEAAFCGNLVDNHKEGTYVCRLCGLPLFSSDSKFNSGTGWPSFFQPVDPDHIRNLRDTSYGMERIEIECARCGAHLGHVFDDGPKPTGLRYCLNSVSLVFYEKGQDLPAESRPIKTETAYFAGGCFWGVEDRFQQVPGVLDAISGYMGGKTKNPTYEQVCTHTTGHAETVKVVYDPAKVTYQQLLAWFFKFHDPTQVDGQGPDLGDNYRSAIFAADAKQLDEAKAFVEQQGKSERFKGRPIATQVVAPDKSGPFYEAEEYHQDYHLKHGGSCPIPQP
jgi:peptide methionine sulfoxide reductase msrA/msrB